jgi:hypothetical protein
LFAGIVLHSSRVNVVHATRDLFFPRGLDAFFRGLIVEAGNQTINEQARGPGWKEPAPFSSSSESRGVT